ncbi:MAG: glycerol-3-phosphate acyltransferase [Lachnospiraceae bacterium]|nr:glycerol-3-phosphate acyltransferase [Lachnospiraceae bacterium]
MFRLWSLLIGYALGNFLTAEIVSRKVSGKSAFDRGTGNPGMANIAALDGTKPALLVLAGDLLKTFLACSAGWFCSRKPEQCPPPVPD